MSQYNLNKMFTPGSVAVIGATDTYFTAGRAVMTNLIDGNFRGPVFPIHPRESEIMGIKAYPSLDDVPEPVDLAVICTAIQTVPGIIEVARYFGDPDGREAEAAIVVRDEWQGRSIGALLFEPRCCHKKSV